MACAADDVIRSGALTGSAGQPHADVVSEYGEVSSDSIVRRLKDHAPHCIGGIDFSHLEPRDSRMRTMALIGIASLTLAAVTPVHGQTAGGAFTAQPGGTIAPTVAAAYAVRDQFNPRETEIEVILSSAPVNVAAAAADLSPHQTMINDPALKDTNYVLVWIQPNGGVSMNATFSKTMTQFLDRTTGGGTLKAELTSNTPEHVAGRIFTASPVKTLDGSTYTVDLTFSTPVAKAPTGTALPRGGGDPGRALDAFLALRRNKDWAGLKATLSPRLTEMFVKDYNDDKENLTDMLQTLEFWLPVKDVAITGGTLMGDAAVLDVEGTMASGIKALTLVRMIKGSSRWLFESATLAGMLP